MRTLNAFANRLALLCVRKVARVRGMLCTSHQTPSTSLTTSGFSIGALVSKPKQWFGNEDRQLGRKGAV